ncbi:MAG: SufE family protein [Deltaproteobacteria bacterium]|nr:SufE family protein [Deltaproteobacteria bacterium]
MLFVKAAEPGGSERTVMGTKNGRAATNVTPKVNHQSLPDELKTDKHKVKGCQSQVWLHAALDEGNVIFRADSDAMIVRGLIAMLLSIYSGATPSEILEKPPAFISEIKLDSHLSPTRTNGLRSMVEQMMYYATAFKTLLAVRGG